MLRPKVIEMSKSSPICSAGRLPARRSLIWMSGYGCLQRLAIKETTNSYTLSNKCFSLLLTTPGTSCLGER